MTRSGSRKLFFCIAGVVLAIGGGIAVWLPPLSPTTKPGISVLGPTNDPAKGSSVAFSLTNSTASQMNYMVCSPQFNSGGTWSPLPQPYGNGFYLPPHQSTNFTVTIPSGMDAWRVPVFFSYPPSGMERFRGRIRYNLRLNWIRWKRGRSPIAMNGSEVILYLSYSPEMGHQSNAEQAGATNRSQATNN